MPFKSKLTVYAHCRTVLLSQLRTHLPTGTTIKGTWEPRTVLAFLSERVPCDAVICELRFAPVGAAETHSPTFELLRAAKTLHPSARRIAIAEVDQWQDALAALHGGQVDHMLYQPLEPDALLAALGLPRLVAPAAPPSAAAHIVLSRR